jgi:hypothetical protein
VGGGRCQQVFFFRDLINYKLEFLALTMNLFVTILLLNFFSKTASAVRFHNQGTKTFLLTDDSLTAMTNDYVATVDKKRHAVNKSLHLVPRGGDFLGISAEDLAKIFCALVSIKAASGTFFPSLSCQLVGVKVPPISTRRLVLEALGGAAGSLSVSSYLTITHKVSSMEKAIAYGLISQLFFLARGIATNPNSMAQIIPSFKLDLLLYTSLVVAILSGLLPEPPKLLLKSIIWFKLFESVRSYFVIPKAFAATEGISSIYLLKITLAFLC